MLIGNQSQTPTEHKDLWATPIEIVQAVEKRGQFTFDLDAAASEHNAKAKRFYTEQKNCLRLNWGKHRKIWLNPPYSKPAPFINKAIEQAREGRNLVVMLLPADTSVRWFELCVKHATEIVFITSGRIAFINNATGKPQNGNSKGSMLVYFDGQKKGKALKTTYLTLAQLKEFAK